MTRHAVVVLAAASLVVGGCGDEEPASPSAHVNAVLVDLKRAFGERLGPVLAQIRGSSPAEPLPPDARAGLRAAAGPLARELRDGAARLSAVNSHGQARRAIHTFSAVVRARASRVEELAAEESVTAQDVRDLGHLPTDQLDELQAAGIETGQ